MSDDDAASILESVAALKHDLAKYVAWRSANFDDEAWSGRLEADLLDALHADILETRGDLSAWKIWDAFRKGTTLQAPELLTVADAVDVLRGVGPALAARDSNAISEARVPIRAAQHAIRSALRDLHRRLLREG